MIDYWQNQRLEAIERALSWLMRDYADWQEPEPMPRLTQSAPHQYQVPEPVNGPVQATHQIGDHVAVTESGGGTGVAEVKSRLDRLETTVMNLLNVVTVLNANLAQRTGMQIQEGNAAIRSRYTNGAIDQAQDRRIAALDAEVTKLQTSYAMLLADHKALQMAHAKLSGTGGGASTKSPSTPTQPPRSSFEAKPSSILKSRAAGPVTNPLSRPSGRTTNWSKP